MQLPESFLSSLQNTKGFHREAFEKTHLSGEQLVSIRFNPSKRADLFLESRTPIPWAEQGYYLDKRPSFTLDPLFHAGCYYVQEASSMFLEQALKQTVDLSGPLKVLDLSAAPGGKSTHIQSLISRSCLLVSNEVIRSRANILKDNIIKWGAENVAVTQNDPRDFAALPGYFDVIVVDAPCSGSGLFRRDPAAVEEWSLNNVQLCSQRQQRILADVWPALKKDGVLIYSTCSYSAEEDEDIVHWLRQQFPLQVVPLHADPLWGIVESGGGYRFWPDQVKGEGFFLACVRKTEGEEEPFIKIKNRVDKADRKEREFISNWVNVEDRVFIKHRQTVYAWPREHEEDFRFLLQELRVLYSGILAGELVREKLVPDHALSMSAAVAGITGRVEVDREQALQYLRRKEMQVPTGNTGWKLVSYEGFNLGWVNILSNRINNYYPKELRILKED